MTPKAVSLHTPLFKTSCLKYVIQLSLRTPTPWFPSPLWFLKTENYLLFYCNTQKWHGIWFPMLLSRNTTVPVLQARLYAESTAKQQLKQSSCIQGMYILNLLVSFLVSYWLKIPYQDIGSFIYTCLTSFINYCQREDLELGTCLVWAVISFPKSRQQKESRMQILMGLQAGKVAAGKWPEKAFIVPFCIAHFRNAYTCSRLATSGQTQSHHPF